jgi:hypothetical protein
MDVFATELEAMIESGAGLVLGTVDDDGAPRGVRAWSASVVDRAAQRVRIVFGADDDLVVENVRRGRVSLTAADVRTFRSVQMKGRVLSVEPSTDADLAATRDQTERFFEAVVISDGNPIEQLHRLMPAKTLTVEIEVDEQFDQTPGPGAGAMLRVGR